MAFQQKTWADRQTEYPGRRRLVATSEANVYDVEREEGLEIVIGDVFNAATMNDLERRINSGFSDVKPKVTSVALPSSGWKGENPSTQSVSLGGVTSRSKVDLQPDATVLAALVNDGVSALYIANNNGSLTAYAVGGVPKTYMTVQATITEVKS